MLLIRVQNLRTIDPRMHSSQHMKQSEFGILLTGSWGKFSPVLCRLMDMELVGYFIFSLEYVSWANGQYFVGAPEDTWHCNSIVALPPIIATISLHNEPLEDS